MQSKSTDFLKKSHLTKHLANIIFIIVCNADTFILNSQLSILNFKWLDKLEFAEKFAGVGVITRT